MERSEYITLVEHRLAAFDAVALLGSRQVGKTTLARALCERVSDFNWQTNYFDLEDPTALQRLSDPKLALGELEGLVVIDEVQRRPDLFAVLRYLLDRPQNRLRLLILGSASRSLLRQSSESLAGRISFIEVSPFSLAELPNRDAKRLWLRGGYPRSYLADSEQLSTEWLRSFVRTYLEQDIPALGINIPAETIRRFWTMLTHVHGNLLNSSELGRSFGVADTTVRHYLDLLAGTFMVRVLPPYLTNTKKRLVKSPKIYFRDSGLLHYLMGIRGEGDLLTHPRLGASWEGFALEQVIRMRRAYPEECYFWAIHGQAELDLVLDKDGVREGYEFKRSSAPARTRSMERALEELSLNELFVVAPVESSYRLDKRITVVPLEYFL